MLTFLCQIILALIIAEYLFVNESKSSKKVVGTDILFGRFICGTILHLSTLNELTCGIANMKFALNHDYLFQNYHLACLCGFLQATAVMIIELVSIQIIFTSLTPLDLVYNFVVLGIITEFDDFVCSSLRNESLKLLVEP